MNQSRRLIVATICFAGSVLLISVLARTGYRFDTKPVTTAPKPVSAMNCGELKDHYRITVRGKIEDPSSSRIREQGTRESVEVVRRAEVLGCVDVDSW